MSYRPRLKKDEQKLLDEYRGVKNAAKEAGISIKDVKHGWLKTKESSLFFNNPLFKDKSKAELEYYKSSLLYIHELELMEK